LSDATPLLMTAATGMASSWVLGLLWRANGGKQVPLPESFDPQHFRESPGLELRF
jgi:hypothetical protein